MKYKVKGVTDCSHVSPEINNGIYPFVSTVDISEGNIDFKNCLLTSESNYNLLKNQNCNPQNGDILFSKDGTIGRTAIITYNKDFVVASSLIIITPDKNKTISLFLNYLLQSNCVLEQINSFVKGTALTRLSITNLKKILGIFPPLHEQELIAQYIEKKVIKISQSLLKIEKQISLLQEYRTALISEVVTGKIDVREEKI